MNRHRYFLILIVSAILLVGCGPSIVVENKTASVRVIVEMNGKGSGLPSPEKVLPLRTEGSYASTAIPIRMDRIRQIDAQSFK